jgi:hypothetical protein
MSETIVIFQTSVSPTNSVVDPLDDSFSPNGVDLASFDDVETAVSIIIVVT